MSLNKISLRTLISQKAYKSQIFNKTFTCHHNTSHGVFGKGKHTGCPFRLKISIYNPNVFYSHPCKISLDYQHNHLLNSADVLRRLQIPKLLDQKLENLFLDGHDIKSARAVILDEIKTNNIDENILHETLADRSIYPDESHCRLIYNKVMLNCYGNDNELENIIANYTKNFNDENIIKIKRNFDNICIGICTPIMRRTHQTLRSSGELVFVDSSGGLDNNMMRVFLFMTHSCAGGYL